MFLISNKLLIILLQSTAICVPFTAINLLFILEFEKMKKKLHTSYVHPQMATSSVQVLDVPEECTEYDIEQEFSRPQLGGGEILSIKRDELLPKVWIVTYRDKNGMLHYLLYMYFDKYITFLN